jgi:hypothetical protein
MAQKYSDLSALLRENPQAAEYYSSLPDYVQETMQERSSNINSLLSLRDYAENLTRGDN